MRREWIASKALIKLGAVRPIIGSMLARVLALFCAVGALAVLPCSASAAPKKVAFKCSATSYSVAENVGVFDVTVQRPGNTGAAASIQDLDTGAGTATGGGVQMVHARQVILCTGALERPFPIPGWTLPGVMTAGAAQILLKSAALVPPGRVVLAGCGPLLWLIAWQYLNAGRRIDLILVGRRVDVLRAGVNAARFAGRAASDHEPMQAVLRLANRPTI